MTSRRTFIGTTLALAALPLLLRAKSNCETEVVSLTKKAAAPKLKASGGASISRVDAAKTRFTIKCAKCGYRTDEIIIDTPSPDKPYTQEWKCPKCGRIQSVVIEVLKA
jgi:transcription elongation factor Elf1